MQRFKKELMNCYADREEGLLHLSDSRGKFVYGANGTLTQAARWRISALNRIEGMCEARVEFAHILTSSIRELLDSSRRGGCRLPA